MSWGDSQFYHLTRDTYTDDLGIYNSGDLLKRMGMCHQIKGNRHRQQKLNKYIQYMAMLHKNLVHLGFMT